MAANLEMLDDGVFDAMLTIHVTLMARVNGQTTGENNSWTLLVMKDRESSFIVNTS